MTDIFFTCWHYTGQDANRRNVEIETVGSTFWLNETELRHGPFRFDELYFQSSNKNGTVYSHRDLDGWRLGVAGPVPEDLKSRLPATITYGHWIDRLGLGKASIALLGISAVAAAIISYSPQWLAPLVPDVVDEKIGDAIVGDFGGRFCYTPEGRRALDKLARKIEPDNKDLKINVAKIEMMNAVAMPGKNVILFQGLLDQSKSVEEVSGVLAHEIGHVRENHVMQGLLRQFGLSVLTGGMDSTGGQMLGSILALGYSRSAEAEADQYSIKAMEKANISPKDTADFFGKLAKLSGELEKGKKSGADKSDGADKIGKTVSYLSSHPASLSRQKEFENSIQKNHAYENALSASEWNDLKSMCDKDKNAKSSVGITNF
ncbi:hypothetical protein LPB140_03775 [Sphingorhabdus lutea]|uniref:Peptidase M48 domain-containing protein n=1 Tax=Sphingorhabdus lutea TaxID=1913578 RepID=A0A1L3JAB7_9SPHN|nr:M48 family metallopeptidase [Sphingorhabdus lutea]APG62075.1 hypothetical protein LPB140_03775 [Sphingorhabdus lutea]